MHERDERQREETIHEFLGGGPRSEEWRIWRDTLERRLAEMSRERQKSDDPAEQETLDQRIAVAEEQIDALATEEIISEFVESEIHLSMNTAGGSEDLGEFDNDDEGFEEA